MGEDQFQRQAGSLEQLAGARFGSLSVAERKLVLAAPKGEIAYCGPSHDDNDPRNDPGNTNHWGPERQIRAELIRWLCLDRRARDRVDPRGIMAHAAKVVGELNLSFVTVVFPLQLWRSALTDDANLIQVEIPFLSLAGSWVRSVSAVGASVKGGVLLNNGFRAEDTVALFGAKIGWMLDCRDGTFINPPRRGVSGSALALNANDITVNGTVFLSKGFRAEGEVRLQGAQIGGTLDCSGGAFINPPTKDVSDGGTALYADGITVNGNLFLSKNFRAEGEVRVPNAQISGSFECTGGTFANPSRKELSGSGTALTAFAVTVKGTMMLSKDFRAEGRVDLTVSRIAGDLVFTKGIFNAVTLDLRDASANSILDDDQIWPDRGKLYLDGFVYGRIAQGSRDAETRLKWLNLQPDRPFVRQPYLQLAKVLREAGDDDGARRVLIAMEDRQWKTKDGRHWIDSLQRWPLRVTVGYGYRPLWAFWEVVGLSALGWIIYRRSYLAGNMVPTDKDAYESFKSEGHPPTHYSAFAPLAYSVENSLPLVKLGQADQWQPDPNPQRLKSGQRNSTTSLPGQRTWPRRLSWLHRLLVLCGLQPDANLERPRPRLGTSPRFLRWFLWIQILIGWLLATLFLAGVTGIVRTG